MKYPENKFCLLILIVSMVFLWNACDWRPEPVDSIEEQEVFIKFFFDPAPVVDFLVPEKVEEELTEEEEAQESIEKHTLFYSETFIEHSTSEIQSLEVTYYYDPSAIVPVNFWSHWLISNIQRGESFVTISVSGFNLKPADYSEVLTITWEALRTSITEVTLHINHLGLTSGKPILPEGDFSETIQVLLAEAKVSIQGPEYSIFEGDSLQALVSLNPEQHQIREFEFDIYFDSNRLDLDSSEDNPGEILMQNFNITMDYFEDRIHVKGWSDTKVSDIQTGSTVDIFKLDFLAEDSGLANISIDMNRMVTRDDVYLNPNTEALSQVITTNDGTPPMVFWFDPAELDVVTGDSFTTIIRVNTENYNLAAYGCAIKYDPEILSPVEQNPIEAGEHGYYIDYNISREDEFIKVTGFSVTGMVELGENLEFLIIHWKALAPTESTKITLKFLILTDDGAIPIPNVKTSPTVIHISE